jgi:hypothetical protein
MKNNYALCLAASAVLAFAALPAAADDAPAAPLCKDGTTSTVVGKGACSHHGGVKKGAAPAAAAATPAAPAAAAPAAAAPAAKTAPAAAAATATAAAPVAGATAKCKDGTFSKSKTHSGACSKHGGVAEWLTS